MKVQYIRFYLCSMLSLFASTNADSAAFDAASTQISQPAIKVIVNGGFQHPTVAQQLVTSMPLSETLTPKVNVKNALGTIRSPTLNQPLGYGDFYIYQASSQLISDDDEDGYYHRFAITFDADVQATQASVYAKLYLRRDNQAWRLFYTTDDFTIVGQSSDDSYRVVTELADGYPSDNYDVLIDLYHVGDPFPVATYSSDDSNALYALPLEDSERDAVNQQRYVALTIAHGGSLSWMTIAGLLLVLLVRLVNNRQFRVSEY